MKALLVAMAFLTASAADAGPALNHVYVVLDQATFDAMRSDPHIAHLLGPSDGGLPDYTPSRADAGRIFLRGRTTYLELFAPKNRFDEPVGKIGIALTEDRPRTFERLSKQWQAYCPATYSRATVVWTRSQPSIPWYDSIQCRETAERPDISIWAMTYRPDFGRWQLGFPATDRRTILAPRRAAGQGRFDIAGLELSLPAHLQGQVARQLIAAGMTAVKRGDATILKGRGWSLTLRRSNRSIVRTIAIRLRIDIRVSSTIDAGTSRLLAKGRNIALTF